MAPAIVPGWGGVLTSMTTPQLRRYDVGLLTHWGSGCQGVVMQRRQHSGLKLPARTDLVAAIA